MRLGEREKGSKIYDQNSQSILMNNDRSHEKINEVKIDEARHVQEKKQIDRMLHGIIKERLFGNFLTDESKLSTENVYHLDKISKKNIYHRAYSTLNTTIDLNKTQTFKTIQKGGKITSSQLKTLDLKSNGDTYDIKIKQKKKKKSIQFFMDDLKRQNTRQYSQRLPKLNFQKIGSKVEEKTSTKAKNFAAFHHKKLHIEQKCFSQFFRRLSGQSNQLIYEIKLSRQTIFNRYKTVIDYKILQRFFHFFGFPQTMGYRQYGNLMKNAVNCNLMYIYFFVFAIIDDNCNGLITASDMFKFMQRFQDNSYVEEEIYNITKEIYKIVSKQFKESEQEPMIMQQMLVVNHNLKMEELKELMKQSAKDRIDANCVKSTCYHQTVVSLEHDYLERIKKDQLEHTELASKKNKNQDKRKKIVQGLRLRDFYQIFSSRRPKIFCFLIYLLVDEKASDFE